MIAICLYFFPPSTKFSGYLEGIIAKHQDETNNIIPTEVTTDCLYIIHTHIVLTEETTDCFILFVQVTVVFVPNLSKYCRFLTKQQEWMFKIMRSSHCWFKISLYYFSDRCELCEIVINDCRLWFDILANWYLHNLIWNSWQMLSSLKWMTKKK